MNYKFREKALELTDEIITDAAKLCDKHGEKAEVLSVALILALNNLTLEVRDKLLDMSISLQYQ